MRVAVAPRRARRARARRGRRRARRHRHRRQRPARRNAASRRHSRARGEGQAARRTAVPTSSRAGPAATRSTPGPETICSPSSYDGSRDSARCGAGTDVVNADLIDTVARDCEIVGRRLSRDPYASADAQHETEVEPDSFTFGRTTVATFQVGRRFEGAATNVGFAVTTDDGRRGGAGSSPGSPRRACRPASTSGRAIRSSRSTRATRRGSSRRSRSGTASTRLAINRSPDGSAWSTAAQRRRGERRWRRGGNRVRQELDRVRQHADVAVLRTLLPRLHPLGRRVTCSRCAGRTTAG